MNTACKKNHNEKSGEGLREESTENLGHSIRILFFGPEKRQNYKEGLMTSFT